MKRFTTLRYLNTLWTLSPLNALNTLQSLRTGGSNQRHVLLRGHRREDLLPPVDAEERDRVHVRDHGNARDQKVTRCNGKVARIPDEHVCSNLKHRTDVRVPRGAQDDRSGVTIVVREPFRGNGRGDLGRVSWTLRALRSLNDQNANQQKLITQPVCLDCPTTLELPEDLVHLEDLEFP